MQSPIGAAYVAVVTTNDDGHQRRHVRLSLKAAQRLVDAAHDRGQSAEIVLALLTPVGPVVDLEEVLR